MTGCNNEKCSNEATTQLDHCGELTCYCDRCLEKYKNIMNAMGSPIPVTYPIGTETT